jgi:hypothetical protein
MSGIKDVNLSWFFRSLHARGMDVTKLAEQLMCGRSHLSQVLNGRRPGGHTWPKLQRVLTPRELQLLGRDVPRGTNSHMEHFPSEAQPWQATG